MILYFLISLFFTTAGISANEIDSCFNNAKQLSASGNYFDAVTEFKRVLFFDNSKIYEKESIREIAYCYKAGARYDDANEYLSLLLSDEKNNDSVFNLRTEIIRLNILRHSTAKARHDLDLLQKEFSDSGSVIPEYASISGRKSDIIWYWRAWTDIFEGKWNNAVISLANIKEDKCGFVNELSEICRNANNQKYSVFFAQLISYILPGAGQFYTGHYLSGAMSLAWTSLFAYYSVDSFISDRAFDTLIALGLCLRFQRGNIENAGKFATEKNNIIDNITIKILQNNFRGLKP